VADVAGERERARAEIERFRAHCEAAGIPGASQNLHWIAAGAGRFVLTLSDGVLVLAQSGKRWRALVKRRDGVEVLATDLPLDYAQGTAEDYARKVGARALVDPKAMWRQAPATDRQLAALRRRRIRARAGLTRGEASDLLAAVFAG
jgi:hypothetical protein